MNNFFNSKVTPTSTIIVSDSELKIYKYFSYIECFPKILNITQKNEAYYSVKYSCVKYDLTHEYFIPLTFIDISEWDKIFKNGIVKAFQDFILKMKSHGFYYMLDNLNDILVDIDNKKLYFAKPRKYIFSDNQVFDKYNPRKLTLGDTDFADNLFLTQIQKIVDGELSIKDYNDYEFDKKIRYRFKN